MEDGKAPLGMMEDLVGPAAVGAHAGRMYEVAGRPEPSKTEDAILVLGVYVPAAVHRASTSALNSGQVGATGLVGNFWGEETCCQGRGTKSLIPPWLLQQWQPIRLSASPPWARVAVLVRIYVDFRRALRTSRNTGCPGALIGILAF